VHIDIFCTYHVNKLIKFIKKYMKKFTHILLIILDLRIKFLSSKY
jgi:hypothetical protein